MPTVLPQPIGDHPPAQGLARDRAAVMLCQLLRRQGRAEVGVAVAHGRQCKVTNFGRQTVIAGFAAALRQQARGTVLLETAQQAKYLTPVQADQFTRVGNTQTTRLNLQQNLKPAELLLAHRHHRHGATPRTPKPEGVSPQLCTGVSSLYCVYTGCRIIYIMENYAAVC